MLSCLSDSNQWKTATKRVDIRTEHCASICEFGIKLPAPSPGGRVGTRSVGKRAGARLRTRNEGGQSLLEFALCLPILMLLLTGMMTFGIALHNYLELTNGVSVGARLIAISRGQTTDPCATVATAVYHAAPFLKRTSLTFSLVLNGITYPGTSCLSSSTTTGAAGNMLQGTDAQLTVKYPCNLKVFGYDYAPSCIMTARTTELMQ
jgi:Flp pilus assembly protein TadG